MKWPLIAFLFALGVSAARDSKLEKAIHDLAHPQWQARFQAVKVLREYRASTTERERALKSVLTQLRVEEDITIYRALLEGLIEIAPNDPRVMKVLIKEWEKKNTQVVNQEWEIADDFFTKVIGTGAVPLLWPLINQGSLEVKAYLLTQIARLKPKPSKEAQKLFGKLLTDSEFREFFYLSEIADHWRQELGVLAPLIEERINQRKLQPETEHPELAETEFLEPPSRAEDIAHLSMTLAKVRPDAKTVEFLKREVKPFLTRFAKYRTAQKIYREALSVAQNEGHALESSPWEVLNDFLVLHRNRKWIPIAELKPSAEMDLAGSIPRMVQEFSQLNPDEREYFLEQFSQEAKKYARAKEFLTLFISEIDRKKLAPSIESITEHSFCNKILIKLRLAQRDP